MALHSRARGSLAQLAPLSPGRKPQERDPLKDQLAQLQREVARLQARLEQAEAVIAHGLRNELQLHR